ncbi:hypothetical protein D1Y84_12080 [Acidipila sp. EB88]|nr:hypothetical protein D1Y84_12080 [Acidipila sp. EB88]
MESNVNFWPRQPGSGRIASTRPPDPVVCFAAWDFIAGAGSTLLHLRLAGISLTASGVPR